MSVTRGSISCGEGGIRTREAFAHRFSRAAPSTTRTPLHVEVYLRPSVNSIAPMHVRRFHYAWVVVAVTLVTLMAAQAVRAAPGIIIVPLEQEFGWDRAAISLAVGVSLLTFGLGGPLGGWLLERFGPRRLLTGGILLIGAGLFALINI